MRIAVIVARGGSKRIPRKNLRQFAGKPLLAHPISFALQSQLFEHVVVSTDDAEIASVAQQWGAKVPFIRPADLSDDHAIIDSVLMHALSESEKVFGPIDEACCLFPSAPFFSDEDFRIALETMTAHAATSSFPIVKYDFPIEQAFKLDGAHPRPVWPDKMMSRSQDLASYFHDAGLFYWVHVDRFKKSGAIFAEDSVAIVIPAERCQDINTESDWLLAEMKYRILSSARA